MAIYNVMTAGAVANGTTDDYAVIQALLNQAGANGGGTVLLPAGIYLVSNTLLVPSNVTLTGEGEGSVLRNPAGALPGVDVNGMTYFATVGMIGVTNAAVTNLSIDHETYGTHANGVVFGIDGGGTPTTFSLVEGVHIEGHNDHSYLIWNLESTDNIIRNNTIDGNVPDANPGPQESIEIFGGHRILVEGNTITNTGSTGIYVVESAADVPGSDIGDIQIIGNTIDGAASGITIFGDTVADNILVRDNEIVNTGSRGITVASSPTGTLNNISVEGNQISNAAGIGIWAVSQGSSNWSNVELIDNNIDGVSLSYGQGIAVNAANVLVEGNAITGATYAGIYVAQSPNAQIISNTVANSGALPIYIELENSSGASLRDNEMVSTGPSAPTATITLTDSLLNVESPDTDIVVILSIPVVGFEADNLVLPDGVTSSSLVSVDGGRTWVGTITAEAGLNLPNATVSVNLNNAWVNPDGEQIALSATANLSIATLAGSTIDGTSGPDSQIGSNGNDTIRGGDGNDVQQGGNGADTLYGGAGQDLLYGQTGPDTMWGGEGNDIFYVDHEGDVVYDAMGEGIDYIFTSVSFALAEGQEIEAIAAQSDAGLAITGNSLNNNLQGAAGNDTLLGGNGDDDLYGYDGHDALSGGNGNDRLTGGSGNDTMIGGNGNDVYIVDSSSDIVIEAIGGGQDKIYTTASFTLGAGQEVELVSASAATTSVTLQANEFANAMIGGIGNDTLLGGAGNDILDGGDGNDRLYGQEGADTMIGGAGNDIFYVDNSGDIVIDTAGIDYIFTIVNYAMSAGQEIEAVAIQDSTGRSLTGNELANNLQGNVGNDILSGNGGDDDIYGYGGNDVLRGGVGNDRLTGGDGNDRLYGEGGSDQMIGGAGDDVFYVTDHGDSVYDGAGGGSDLVVTTVNFSMIAGQEIEGVQLVSAAGRVLIGNETANALRGDVGDDGLFGGGGDDDLYGLNGNDSLDGGSGNDRLTGGAGADVFVFGPSAGADFIVDFQDNVDILDLSMISGLTDWSDLVVTTYSTNDFVLSLGGASVHIMGDVTTSTIQNDIIY